MKIYTFWKLLREADGTYTLVAPNGSHLFTVASTTLRALGHAFLEETGGGEREKGDCGVVIVPRREHNRYREGM